MATARPDGVTLTAFLVGTVLFGSNFVAVRFSNQELPPFFGAAVRFALAALLLFVYVAMRRIPVPMGRAFVGAVWYGTLTFGVFFGLMYWGLQEAPAGVGSTLFALLPLATLLLAVLQQVEPFRWRGLVGGLVGAVGITLVYRGSLSLDVPAAAIAAILVGVFVAAQAGIVVKRFPRSDPFAYNAVGMTAGTIVLFVFSLVAGEPGYLPTRTATWLALAYLVLFGSIAGFVLMVVVIQRWTVSAASYQAVLQPLVTLAVAAWLLDEVVTDTFVLGGVLVMLGVYIGALHRPRTSRAALDEAAAPAGLAKAAQPTRPGAAPTVASDGGDAERTRG